MDDKEKFKKLRDIFRELADIMDEMLNLKDRLDKGEDMQKDFESAVGRYLVKSMEASSLE